MSLFLPDLEANEQPLSEDGKLNTELRTAEQIINQFMQESLEFRLEHEFFDGLCDETDRSNFLRLCRKTTRELGLRYEQYRQRLDEIEGYEEDDWDELYGETGLWRRTSDEARKGRWYNSQVEYFLAVASEQKAREKILVDIILLCEAGEGFFGTPAGELLQAEASCAIGSEVYLRRARKIIDTLLAREGLGEAVYFKGRIVQLKLDESINGMRILEVVEDLRQSEIQDDFELNMRLAFLGVKVGWFQLLEEAVTRWPGAEDFVGRLLLKKMVRERPENVASDKSIFEVEAAVKAALQDGVSEYKQMILKLCDKENYRTALTLYGVATACEESEPVKAFEFYMQAARARAKEKNGRLGIEAAEIMRQGAELACKLYHEDSEYIEICEKALREYFELAGQDSEEGLRYFYVGVLDGRGRKDEAAKLLAELAEGQGVYSLNARLNLIKRELMEGKADEADKEKTKEQLKELIDSAESFGERGKAVKSQAVKIYCRMLLEGGDEEFARRVISMLEGGALLECAEEVFLKAKALGILGRWSEAVSIAANGIEPNECGMAVEAFSVLSGVIERLEENAGSVSSHVFVDDCRAIAEYCIACLEGLVRADVEIIRAELMLLDQPDERTLEQIETILAERDRLDNIEVLRCRARLSVARGNFSEAAMIWGRICTARAGIDKSEGRDWRWWRAKFNQLYCFSRSQGEDKEQIIRSIEILERSFNEIPVFWAEKLEDLKAEMAK